jgi:hypothetical protein
VSLADADDSEPEAGLDWDDYSEEALDGDEEERLLARLPPSDTALFEHIRTVLAQEHTAPTFEAVAAHFVTEHKKSLQGKEELVHALLAHARQQQHWHGESVELAPGQAGFNDRAHRVMKAAGLDDDTFHMHAPTKGSTFTPQPYQRTVSFLVHPFSVMSRLLVAHRTGAGKTYSMIRILDNYFFDPRCHRYLNLDAVAHAETHTLKHAKTHTLAHYQHEWCNVMKHHTHIRTHTHIHAVIIHTRPNTLTHICTHTHAPCSGQRWW